MSEHKFKIGQMEEYASGPRGAGHADATYKVTQRLPAEDGDFQYRIRNAGEPHERVVKESQLHRAA